MYTTSTQNLGVDDCCQITDTRHLHDWIFGNASMNKQERGRFSGVSVSCAALLTREKFFGNPTDNTTENCTAHEDTDRGVKYGLPELMPQI